MKVAFSRRNGGFTLVEVIMVAFMLGLVMASVYSLYSTSQKAASMEDEVVDVQQNLRIAMDSMSRDIRHAGFLSSQSREIGVGKVTTQADVALNGNVNQPVNTILDNSANTTGLRPTVDVFSNQPERVHADLLVLNYASPFTAFAKIAAPQVGITAPFTVRTPESVDLFSVNDRVRIINPTRHEQSSNLSPTIALGGPGTVFVVNAVDRTVPSITLAVDAAVAGNDPSMTEFKLGDIIARVSTNNWTYPNTITYCLGPAQNCGPNIDCPQQGAADQTRCLVRMENGTAQIIASRLSGLQFTYLTDDGNEVLNPALVGDLGSIRAIRVAISGRTATVSRLATGLTTTEKERSMSSLIALKNRLIVR
jgi:type II secretory pathway pseudopilin PulG